jgi:hypothetical protein
MTGIQGSSPLALTEWDGARTASLTEWSTVKGTRQTASPSGECLDKRNEPNV